MAAFKSAYTTGQRFATGIINFGNRKGLHQSVPDSQHEPLENVIFEAMGANPYTSDKARQDFINGVSDTVNANSRTQNREMNRGK